MIIVKLMGGLGNQMFQYALARNLSLKNNVELVFDFESFKRGGRQYCLDCFDLQYREATNQELKLVKNGRWQGAWRQLNNIIRKNKIIYYKEKNLNYDANVFEIKNDICIEGYWQSEKYFFDIRNVLLNDFKIKNELSGENIIIANKIRTAKTAVSVHIRRGDYVSNKNANMVHGLCDIEYYNRGIRYIENKEGELELFVFSDDVEWAQKNIRSVHRLNFVKNNSEECGFEDLRLMSICKHNIIANSSFSWWGAWLNINKEKIVIAPKQWFKDETKNSQDIIPALWVKL